MLEKLECAKSSKNIQELYTNLEREITKNWIGDLNAPIVSIVCCTFNHEEYIADALNGFLSQVTNFPFEIIVHDDASTDRTAHILETYVSNYPNLIKLFLQQENQHSKGVKISATFLWPHISGKYVATCEGDDYWIDSKKLQRQVDYLENNLDFAGCSCYTAVTKDRKLTYPSDVRFRKLTFLSFCFGNKFETRTVSRMYRTDVHKVDNRELGKRIRYGDNYFRFMMLQTGNLAVLPYVMCVYRVHKGGIYSLASSSKKYANKRSDLKIFIAHTRGLPRLGFCYQLSKLVVIHKLSSVLNSFSSVK